MPTYRSFLLLMGFIFLIHLPTEAQPTVLQSDLFYKQLALRWAPIHVQYVCKNGKDGLNGRADYITAVDYDGDWDMNNNWENLAHKKDSLVAYVYYSIVQTSTHWFINYAFFHPRDWSNKFIIKAFDTHENDLEGQLSIIKRPNIASDTSYGKFLGMISVFHSGFYPFSNILNGKNQKVKKMEFWQIGNQLHPVTCQQSRGHGLKAYPNIQEKKHESIHYFPSLDAATAPNNNNDKKVSYQLVDIFEKGGLWEHRNNPKTFISPTGGFNGTYGGKYKAKPPWVWNSSLDALKGGEHATDPVKLATWYFEMAEDCSEIYEWNGYLE